MIQATTTLTFTDLFTSRYSHAMFDVLVYLYEHYWRPDACPEAGLLARKLSAAGFESEEINEALAWLNGLQAVNAHLVLPPSSDSARVYTDDEFERLGPEALGFLQFLGAAGVLSPSLREVVLERVSALPRAPVALEDFKILVLLVFWSAGEEPDALILDELFVDDGDRLIH
jgi:Smg protein